MIFSVSFAMSFTRIDCQFHRPEGAGERSGYVAINPSKLPGSLVFAGSTAALQDYVVEKRPVAGFRHGDALYCVVASAGTRALTKDAPRARISHPADF